MATAINSGHFLKVKSYSTDEGLSQKMIYNIVQDQDGFIWISTWDGLEKFDGYTFRNFKSYPTDSVRLLYNRLISISTGPENGLWCETYESRFYIFDTRREEFIDPFAIHPNVRNCEEAVSHFYLPDGILYLAGRDGSLWRIDGKNYRERGALRYFPATRAERGETIYGIYPDGTGGEWVLSNHGYWVYGKDNLHGLREFRSAVRVGSRLLLIDSKGKAAVYNSSNGKITDINTDGHTIRHQSLIHIISDTDVIVDTEKGLAVFDIQSSRFCPVDISYTGNVTRSYEQVLHSGKKILWLLTDASDVMRIDLSTLDGRNLRKPYTDSSKSLGMHFIHCDHSGEMWIYPPNGHLCHYNESQEELECALTNIGQGISRVPDFVSYTIDIQGNLWGNTGKGIQMITIPQHHNIYLNNDGSECRGLMIDSKDRLWVGFKNNCVSLYQGNDYNHIGNLSSSGRIINNGEIKFGAPLYSMMEDSHHRIWLGSKGQGLYIAIPDASGKNFTIRNYRHNPENPTSISSDAIYSFYEDKNGRIWVGTYGGGLNLVEEGPHGELAFMHSSNGGLPSYPRHSCKNVRYITCTSDGVMMVATTGGFITFRSDFKSAGDIKFHLNKCDLHRDSTLSNNDIAYAFEDSRKNIYLAVLSGGICCTASHNLLSDSIAFSYIGRREGLPTDMAYSIKETKDGSLWFQLDNAICRYDRSSGHIESFDRHDFHHNLPCGEVPFIVDKNGIASFGLINSVMIVDFNTLTKCDYIPNVLFSGARTYSDEQGEVPIPISDGSLSLKPWQRNLSVSFVAIDYNNTENISYSYRLRGFNDHWIDNGHNRSASFYALPAGDYVLEVKSTNGEGVWNDKIFCMPIHIEPTFIETIWAKLLYILAFLLIGLTVWYVSVYILRLHRRIDIEQDLTSMKLKFFTDVSHELRTPLSLIVNPIEEVIADRNLSPRSREYMVMAKSNTDRMMRLINQFLDIRKIQNSKMKIYLEKIDVVRLIERIHNDFRGLAEQKNIKFIFCCPMQSFMMYTDVDKLEKIVFNLLSNAFKYTSEGASVTLSASREENMLHVKVHDEGAGIEEWQIGSLFNRFETLGSKKHVPSSGIGLSLVKELVGIMHGRVTASGKKGVGSTFEVFIPGDYETYSHDSNVELILTDDHTSQEDTVEPVSTTSSLPSTPSIGALTIMIVEDNAELRRMISNMLSDIYNLVEASDGEDALAKLSDTHPDMIISDIMMPNIDGLELLTKVRADREWSHIPFILLTAKSSVSERIEGLECGADDYITKPFSSSYLKARLCSLIAQRTRLLEFMIDRKGINLSEKIVIKDSDSEDSGSKDKNALPALSKFDSEFTEELMGIIEQEYHRPKLTIDEIASHMKVGRTVFNRKVKSLFNSTPVELLASFRLKRACDFLVSEPQLTVAEITYKCGFASPQYFNRVFKSRYGCTPLEWRHRHEV